MSKIGLVGGIAAAAIVAGGVLGTVLCIERIPTGYVGVVYSMNGGVQE